MAKIEIKQKKRNIINEKEILVLNYIANGYSDQEIADEMSVKYSRICAIVREIMTKSNTVNRAHLVKWGFVNNYLKG